MSTFYRLLFDEAVLPFTGQILTQESLSKISAAIESKVPGNKFKVEAHPLYKDKLLISVPSITEFVVPSNP